MGGVEVGYITENTFKGNQAHGAGGALAVQHTSITAIDMNLFEQNKALGPLPGATANPLVPEGSLGPWLNGGLVCLGDGGAWAPARGGAMVLWPRTDVTSISSSVFFENSAQGGGGAVAVDSTGPVLKVSLVYNCTFLSNSASPLERWTNGSTSWWDYLVLEDESALPGSPGGGVSGGALSLSGQGVVVGGLQACTFKDNFAMDGASGGALAV
ncbi:unnamed protein product, partial [Discosporangium mesarthrocarpum]